MTKCPKCGSTDVGVIDNGRWFCPKCGHEWSAKATGGSGVSMPDATTLILSAIALVLLVVGYAQTRSLITYMLSIIYPDFQTSFIDLGLIILSMMVLLAFIAVARSGTIPGMFMLTFMGLYLIFFPVVTSFVQSDLVSKYLNVLGCTLQYSTNPQAMSACQQFVSAGTPTSVKEGGKVVLKASFDQYSGSVIYASADSLNYDAFLLSVIIENPSATKTISNFHVSDGTEGESYLTRGGNIKEADRIKLAYLTMLNNECGSILCSIAPGEKKTLSFKAAAFDYCDLADARACETAADKGCVWDAAASRCSQTDKTTAKLDAKVAFSYDYEAQGSFDFVLANSNAGLATALAARKSPTSSAGPVDVIVYFVPTYYVTAAGKSSEMRMTITLNNLNLGKTADVATPVHVTRLNDGALARSGTTCVTPWGTSDFKADSAGSTTDQILVGLNAHLSKSQTYICAYSITAPQEWAGMTDVSKAVPFIADVKYTYNDYISLSESGVPISVERM
jgi:hypothetical protein